MVLSGWKSALVSLCALEGITSRGTPAGPAWWCSLRSSSQDGQFPHSEITAFFLSFCNHRAMLFNSAQVFSIQWCFLPCPLFATMLTNNDFLTWNFLHVQQSAFAILQWAGPSPSHTHTHFSTIYLFVVCRGLWILFFNGLWFIAVIIWVLKLSQIWPL